MAKSKRKTEAQKEREAAKSTKPKAPEKPKTLDELLKPENDYERLVAEHVRGRHDAALEAAIVEHQRSIADCLAYVAGVARGRSGAYAQEYGSGSCNHALLREALAAVEAMPPPPWDNPQ